MNRVDLFLSEISICWLKCLLFKTSGCVRERRERRLSDKISSWDCVRRTSELNQRANNMMHHLSSNNQNVTMSNRQVFVDHRCRRKRRRLSTFLTVTCTSFLVLSLCVGHSISGKPNFIEIWAEIVIHECSVFKVYFAISGSLEFCVD